MYPTLLEFAVEATFPSDEAVTTAILFVSSSVLGVMLMYLDDALSTEMAPGTLVRTLKRFQFAFYTLCFLLSGHVHSVEWET